MNLIQDMTHRMSNKNSVWIPAMRARMALVGLVLFLSGGNAAAQEGEGSGDSPSGGGGTTATGVIVNGSVYGGGNLAEVGGSVVVNIKAGRVVKDVYGGGALANTNTSNWNPTGVTYKPVSVTVEETVVTGLYEESGGSYTVTTDETASEGKTYYQQIIGTWASGMVDATGKTTYFTTVNLTGGTINGDAYGGGLGRLPASVHYTQEEADAYNREHGLSSGDSGYKTTADWQPEVKATVYGDISVNLGSSAAETSATAFNINYYQDNANTNLDESTLVNSGRVFGGNNLNGSPQGNVTVTVYKTVKGNTDKTASDKLKSTNDGDHHYQVAAVYGGGNLSNYEPTTTGKKAHVIINGCSVASILTVYGGGNAAAVPETDVDIYGSYEIGAVFGGGNGKDPYTLDNGTTWATNPGANVNGNANTMLYGGLIHEAFGGSNEKGRITGNVSINTDPDGSECDLDVGTIYGAGKNADIDGDLIVTLGCMQKRTDAVYGGAENANVKGNVELTITSGEFGKVFGGNNQSGAIFGSITLNIMESGCSPIEIDELYLGGNQAAYSVYGYYKAQYYVNEGNYYLDANSKIPLYAESGQLYLDNAHTKPLYQKTGETYLYLDEECTKPFYMPRTSADDSNPIETFADINEHTVPNTTVPNTSYKQYADPVLNIVSATKIGKVFGGGLGSGAAIYGNPTVNINQAYPLAYAGYNSGTTSYSVVTQETLGAIGGGYTYKDESDQDVTVEGGIYGGGNEAYVYGNTTVNIGTERTVDWKVLVLDGNQKPVLDANGKFKTQDITGQTNNVMGANIAGNVYGGGNQADVTGNTFVNVCAEKSGTTYNAVAEGSKKVTIAGNVFGGGKGVADNFLCDKAMVGTNDKGLEDNYTDGNTSVIIGNGTVNRNVYGGGEVGRVEMNTTVTVGLPGTVTSSPDIKGDVFGGGMGDKEHGYAGLVRGNPTVTIQANTKVEHNVYGGGEIASVARYKVPTTDEELAAAHNGGYPEAVMGRPYALKDPNSGFCTVTVQGNAVIGPDYAMEMTKAGGPDDAGHVFGAGKGIMPENYDYASETVEHKPRCRANNDEWTWFADIDEYIAFIQTLALSSQTTVNIGNVSDSNSKPFIKGSVYGGSENGLVQFDTNVYIKSGQIGCGKNTTKPHVEDYPTVWDDNFELPTDVDLECSSWDYGIEEGEGTNKKTIYAPYDPNANVSGNLDKYPSGESTEGGRKVASDGHTYYGNVFGGGSGSVPYFDTTEGISKYLHSAGTVKGNTNVTISGGHILTSVYGGCEATNVMGTANVTMTGGTIGVPRTDTQILAHPVTCNLFGAGKGDQRVFFNKDTNVNDAVVTVSGGRIYGSVFGGGEDGHIMRNSTVTISGANTKIGTKGTSYMDGNVFGGGRGFGGDALTAGNVGGAVTLNIENGYVLGSVYGGGRLASVGYGLYLTTETGYGEMRADDVWDDPNKPITSKQTAAEFFDKGRGKITINISGGTIGNDVANAEYGGNVFGGSMGSLTKQDGTLNTQWDKFATAKKTTVNVSGGTIKRSVYGGGELGTVTTDAVITVSGGTIGKPKEGTTVYGGAVYGNIYGGGKGYVDPDGSNYITAGIVKGNTYVTVENSSTTVGETTTTTKPTIYHNIYGGGAYGSVGDFNYDSNTGLPTGLKDGTTGGTANITITGGTIGTDGKENGMVFGSSRGDVDAPGSIQDKLAWVYDTHVTIGTSGQGTTLTTPLIKGSVYGSGENGHTFNDTEVIVHSGTIGIADGEPIVDNNGTPDDDTDDITYEGAAYPYRGNVYGGGCGTDKYYQDLDGVTNPYDGNGDTYNPLAGIVYGTTTVTMDGGQVVHNIYGAGAMGSVGKMNTTGAITSGGTTTIEISGGTVGVDGTVDDGNVFGAARGDATAPKGLAQVKTTNVTISGTATGTIIKGNVYGGGALGDVGTYTYNNTTKAYTWDKVNNVETGDCHVTVNGGTIAGYVYGAGKGIANTFECEKALVRTTDVSINAGTVNHNVYGGGEIGRVDQDTKVTLGAETGTSGGEDAIIVGEVFGAGKGLETHGYSALVRGNAEVVVQGNATVGGSVYGGGEIAAVGRYRLDENEMPTALVSGGECKVTVKGYAVVGQSGTGNVFGAGKGVDPSDATHTYIDFTSTDNDDLPKRMTLTPSTLPTVYDNVGDGSMYIWEYYTSQASYFKFLQTLALATDTKVSIEGNATVNGNVYGGSESGFVQRDTEVEIKGGAIGTTGTTTDGNIFGGGKGLDVFAEAGRVRGNATVAISGGNIADNVYGGGELGHVGSFTETTDGRFVMQKIKDKDNNDMDTGLCTITITGGKVGSDTNTDSNKGNVFGAGKGKDDTFKCEKAMAMNTSVSINTGAVNGDVFGGGEIGRVEYNSRVTMGSGSVKRSIFGGGAGAETHGYSALVRGNTTVTIQGGSVGESVYGGGEIASVGRYGLDAQKMPSILLGGGYCYVTVKGSATIGSATEAGDVFGAGKGVDPSDATHTYIDFTSTDKTKLPKRMTVYNADDFPESAKISTTGTATAYEGSIWEYFDESVTPKLVWEYFQDETKYNNYLETLALATHPEVNIDGEAHVYGSVFGGGELGITKGSVFVNILGGTIEEDVYGGGSLANTNTTSSIGKTDPDTGAAITDSNGNIVLDEDIHPTTTVNLLGGHIKGDAYGGGLGQLDLPAQGIVGQQGYQAAVPAIEAKVFGDVKVNLNGLQSDKDMNATTVSTLTSLEDGDTGYKKVKPTAKGAIVNRVFGCNNLNGSPQKKVQVYVYGTQSAATGVTQIANAGTVTDAKKKGRYDVAAVYGGGNLSPYVPADALLPYTDENKATVDAARTEVYIDGCDRTSIQQVYGGGNAASAPATFVQVNRCFEINEVFGGGNGFDDFSLFERGQEVFYKNSGANVGYYTGYYTNYATYGKYATRTSGGGSGTQSDPRKAVEDSQYTGGTDNKDTRLAAKGIQYGSGIARLEVKGGTVNTSYGGSNSKGNVRALLSSVYSAAFDECPMSVGTSYGGGKNAYSDADSDMQADCAKGVKTMFGGSENADFDGHINMRITNGSSLEKVFGGNNTSGAVNGSITITIEEGGCEPIRIGELYLGGFLAPYSVYGYAKNEDGSYKTELVKYIDDDGNEQEKLQRIPLKKGDEGALSENDRYPDPRINVISATYIGDIFGGGYQAKLVGNPHVNVNMTTGFVKVTKTEKAADDTNTYPYEFQEDGKTYYYKDVAGNTYNKEKVGPDPEEPTVLIATTDVGTIGNIYGGGNMADIIGDTYVEIGTGTEHNAAGTALVPIASGRNAAKITGNVFGGGKGKADSFKCAKAMVGVEDSGSGSTNVIIGNGTVEGSVYGGGEIGRVEANTNVTIGLEDGTGEPVIKGNVFGAGRGVHTHGYAALVRGNATVTVQGEAKVRKSVYGGGEIASVGKYNIADAAYHAEHPEVLVGMPYSLVSDNKGICNVIVRGNAVIGPEGSMEMKATGGPDDTGHVFGAGRGVLPYHDIDGNIITGDPWRMKPGDNEHPTGIVETFNETTFSEAYYTELYGSDYNKKLYNYLADYLRFIETLALTTQTEVTIGGKAFVKGSVYGGSENGHVQHDTHVTIQDFCQIGHSAGVSTRFTEDEWESADPAVLKECASWDYVATEGAPYDPLAKSDGTYDYTDYQFVPVADRNSRPTSEGGKPTATDGHTYYGNVFGGGSGVIPYAPGRWHREAGSVGGNTQVDITGGHIMTSVYGGNEQTDVGTYELDPDNDFQPTIPKSGGKCTINMTGGTLGVPRTPERMKTHPVTCYLFGAGKGDQRIFFNTWTNVINTEVNISGTARIYGSTFGGGEDGHVILNAVTKISGDKDKVLIGTTGTSYVDGNVFGGGRGFSGEAQTAGTVGGNVEVNISGGTMLGSIYGGGRLASVGTLFTAPDDPNYGNFVEDGGGKTYGHVAVNISGGTIGNTVGNAESGNVFGGSMGRLNLLNGNINPIWPKMAQVKETNVTISGNAVIKRTVYGGGELGTVRDNATVNINGGTVNRDVYGAGYGSKDYETKTKIEVKVPKEGVTNPTSASDYDDVSYVFTPMIFAGCVGQNTYVNIAGGQVKKSVYGGGEMASVGIMDCRVKIDNNATDPVYTEGTDKYVYKNFHSHLDENNGFALSWPFHFENAPGYFGATHVNITGGRIGVANGDSDINTDNGDVYGGGKGIAGEYKNYVYCANVGSAEVTIDYPAGNTATPQNYMTNADIECIAGAVYGGAENGHVMGNTKLTLKNGLIGHSMYGGGSGKGTFSTTLLKIGSTSEHYTRDIYSFTAGKVFGNSTVEMSGGTVVRNVYGGGNMGSVGKGNYAGGTDDYSTTGYGENAGGNLWTSSTDGDNAWQFLNSGICTVNITGGTIGYIDESDPSNSMYPWNSTASLPYGNVFGGCRGESAPNIVETPRYLYSPEFFVGYANETAVTIGKTDGSGPTILGSVYGGGMDGHIRRDASVTILGGEIGIPFTEANKTKVKTSDLNDIQWLARGNVYGSGSGIGKYKYDFDYDGKYESTVKYDNGRATVDTKEEDYSTSAGSVTRFTTVDIKGGTIHRNVYGGGSLSSIGAPKIGQSYDPYHPGDSEHSSEVGKQSLNKVTISGGQIGDADCLTSGYGGEVNGGSRGAMAFENSLANPASFANSVYTEVTISDDADVKGNVFGGGEAGIVKHDTEVKMQGGTVGNDLYGGGDLADVGGNTVVDMTGGTIKHDAFGGARGTADVAAEVKGNATVTLNGTKFIPAFDINGILTGGRIFGANNVNGTPKGHVKVHVLQTVDSAKDPSVALAGRTTYDVGAVYGGGNNADYKPTETTEYAEVIIDGCEKTSIKYVFGGGNAAATPANEVMINGCYIIDNVFGGGNGTVSPANVGYDETDYKTMGTAKTNLSGGYIHNVYGGSNNQGNILGGASVTNEKLTGDGCCDNLQVQEIYGGGKQADMFGGAEIILGCMPNDWIGAIYAGAENADIGGDVGLTLTSGKFGRVFGGNKSGGKIDGYIEVNIEENPECSTPIIIGGLYGGGNEAPYKVPQSYVDGWKAQYGPDADYPSPRVNVRAFTSIGNIYGGGFGASATVTGNPLVNINVVEGGREYAGEDKPLEDGTTVTLHARSKDAKMGVIGNVFGGGNAAPVIGNTNVMIGTEAKQKMLSLQTKDPDGTVHEVEKDVLGADIRGNVYGGGNAAEVKGETNVVIGKEKVE